jgi:hypothetical protein
MKEKNIMKKLLTRNEMFEGTDLAILEVLPDNNIKVVLPNKDIENKSIK